MFIVVEARIEARLSNLETRYFLTSIKLLTSGFDTSLYTVNLIPLI